MADELVQIIDVSEHQGVIDFAVMKAKGVDGVIIRACHGLTRDKRLTVNSQNARRVFGPNVAYYEFCNPKRGSARACADYFVDVVHGVDPDAHGFMADVEQYGKESPSVGVSLPAPQYAAWLEDHFARLIPAVDDGLFGYTNRAYWNGDNGVDHGVFSSVPAAMVPAWIGARYPLYSEEAYQRKGYPPLPAEWERYAYSLARGPVMPTGAFEVGWQFSAGWNRQGPVYGCQSTDLDLNLVRRSWWLRLTGQTASPPRPDTAPTPPIVVTKPEELSMFAGWRTNGSERAGQPAGVWQYALIFDGEKFTKYHVQTPINGNVDANGMRSQLVKLSNEELDAIPDFAGMVGFGGAAQGFTITSTVSPA